MPLQFEETERPASGAMPNGKARKILGWTITLFVIPLLVFLVLHYPDYRHGTLMYWDEGQHLAAINRMFHGEVLYRDIYDISAPLPEIIPYLMMKATVVDISVLRVFYYYGNLLSLFVVYLAAVRLIRGRITLVLVLFLCAEFMIFNYWASRWGGFRIGSAYVALLFLWFYIDSHHKGWLLACGVAVAGSLLFSPEMGAIAFIISSLVILVDATMLRGKVSLPKLSEWKDLLLFLAGFVAGLSPWLVYCVATGSLKDYFIINFIDIPFRLTKALPYGYELDPFPGVWYYPSRFIWFWTSKTGWFILAWMILGIEAMRLVFARIRQVWTADHTKRLTLFVFGIFLLVMAKRCIHVLAPQLNYSLPPVLLLFTLQFQGFSNKVMDALAARASRLRLKRLWPANAMRPLPQVILLALLLFHMIRSNYNRPYELLEPYHTLPEWMRIETPPEDGVLDIPRARNVRMPVDQARLIQTITEFIQENTLPSEPIFAFPEDGRFYFLADRPNATRYDIALNTAIRKEYELEAIRDLERNKPPYVIHDEDAIRLGGLPDGIFAITNEERTPLLSAYFLSHYRTVLRIEETNVMERFGRSRVKKETVK